MCWRSCYCQKECVDNLALLVTYHPEVQASTVVKSTKLPGEEQGKGRCTVPTMRICLIQNVLLKPDKCAPVQAQVEGGIGTNMQPLLAESDRVLVEERGLQMVEVDLLPNKDGLVQVSLVNRLGIITKEGASSRQGTTSQSNKQGGYGSK